MPNEFSMTSPETMKKLMEFAKSEASEKRVAELEAEGLTTSDAQGVADAEFLNQLRAEHEVQ